MPVVFIEAPPGIRGDAKKQMVEKITTAIDDGLPHRGHPDLSAGIPA